jgi:transcriptional regulator GlxA family with amidase domain
MYDRSPATSQGLSAMIDTLRNQLQERHDQLLRETEKLRLALERSISAGQRRSRPRERPLGLASPPLDSAVHRRATRGAARHRGRPRRPCLERSLMASR